jgi:hypothetical protein
MTIYFVYHIALSWFKNQKVGIIAAVLYAGYPFIIVWTSVVYSEWLSVFFMFWSLFVLREKITVYRLFLSALLIGLGALNRPQLLLLIPFYLYFINRTFECKPIIIKGLIFSLGIILSYGLWPLRNYINHDKIILTQDLRGIPNWDVDVLGFLQYIYSVKAEWEPQFSQIIENKKVDWPANAYTSVEDSIKLVQAVYNAQHCSRGFSCWQNYWKEPIENEGCTAETAELFNKLRSNQINAHPLNFYLILPLKNLKKALFKISLTKPSSRIAGIVGSLLFAFRSLLLLLGILGGFVFMKQYPILWIIIGYFMVLYLSLCFGTSPQMRNIEMRYFLHADLLLLFPIALLIDKISLNRLFFFNNGVAHEK